MRLKLDVVGDQMQTRGRKMIVLYQLSKLKSMKATSASHD